MPSVEILAFNHTSVVVPSIREVLPFFTDALGYELRSHGGREPADIEAITGVVGADIEVAFLARPGHVLELIEYLSPASSIAEGPKPNELGASHLAYDVADIEKAVEVAASHGFRPANTIMRVRKGPNTGRSVVYVRDAHGLTIEFMEDPK